MKKTFFLLSLIFPIILFSQTHIPEGNVNGIWIFENSPYIIDGEISIESNELLTIEPGVEVIFSNHYKFNILGRLLAEGTETDSIYFTAQNSFLGWHGLRFSNTDSNDQDSSKVVYCRLEYGKANGSGFYENMGGAIFCYYSSDILIDHCSISDNSAEMGGGVFCYSSDPEIRSTIISNNEADYGGGIECYFYSNPDINDVIISNNSAIQGGGFFCKNSSDAILNNVTIEENSADYGGGFYCYDSAPLVTDCYVIENNAGHDGGGILITEYSEAIFENVLISGNTTFLDGGGVFCSGNSTPVFNNVTISENNVPYSDQPGAAGFCCWGASPVLNNATIINNTTMGSGGGISCKQNSNLYINGGIIKNNYARWRGGGIVIYSSTINLSGVTISENLCNNYTGGIYFGYSSETIFDPDNRCNIYLNNSYSEDNTGNDFQAYNDINVNVIVDTFTVLEPTEYYAEPLEYFTFDILHCKIEPTDQDLYVSPNGSNSNNGLTPEEPLLSVFYAINMINPDEENNLTIHLAEGIYSPSTTGELFPLEAKSYLSIVGTAQDLSILDGEDLSRVLQCYESENFSIQDLTIKNGYESHFNEGGGGISCMGTEIYIHNVSLLNNRSYRGGGGIIIGNGSEPVLSNVLIKNNESTHDSGGGISCSSSNPVLSSVTITENTSNGSGGGIYFSNSDPVFDFDDRCNIYLNNTPYNGNDIGAYNCDVVVFVFVDTFTVLEPDDYYASPIEDFTFDILHPKIVPVNADLYVSPDGSDSNNGLTPGEPLQTITWAYRLIAPNSLDPYSILLANGVYSPSQTGESFPITCRSNVNLVGEDRELTILDAEETSRVMNCLFPHFSIQNLTIKNGYFENEYGSYGSGGGICIYQITGCELNNLRIYNNYSGSNGGGIYCDDSDCVFDELLIDNNSSNYGGGGIFLEDSNPVFRNLTIKENSAHYGGGICFDDSYPLFDPENRCNIYQNNSQYGYGRDLNSSNYSGIIEVIVDTFTVLYPDNYFVYPMDDFSFNILNAIIEQVDSNLYVSPEGSDENSGLTPDEPLRSITYAFQKFVSNPESPNTIFLSEGVYSNSNTDEDFPIVGKNFITIQGDNADTTILDGENDSNLLYFYYNENIVLENITIANGNSNEGGGIDCYQSQVCINNIVFRNNIASYRGGAINSNHSNLVIINVTLVNNSAWWGSGLYGEMYSDVFIANSIFWNEFENEIYFPYYNGSNDFAIVFSDIQGGEESIIYSTNTTVYFEENIDPDPLFVDPDNNDFHLQTNSPCIDSGIAFFEWNDEIIIDLSEDEYFGEAPDMGAFEYYPVNSDDLNVQDPIRYSLSQNYPNPFNPSGAGRSPSTIISYSIPIKSDVCLNIYNIKGQKVRTLINEKQEKGIKQIVWNGTDNNNKTVSSGIYFYRLQTGDFDKVRKMVLLQ